jgi:hypothetical protein
MTRRLLFSLSCVALILSACQSATEPALEAPSRPNASTVTSPQQTTAIDSTITPPTRDGGNGIGSGGR